MLLTRRTFMQTSLAASVSVAAESSHARWLLNSSNPIRIGVAGLGSSASEHLALYGAIPGARVAHIADESAALVDSALLQLKENNHPAPRVSRSISELLQDPSLDALSLPAEPPSACRALEHALNTGLPVLVDVLPASFSPEVHERTARPPIHLRIADFTYAGAAHDIDSWSNRNAETAQRLIPMSARLSLETGLTIAQTRAVMISALNALLAHRTIPAGELIRWSGAHDAVIAGYGSPVAGIRLPHFPNGSAKVEIDLLPRHSGASVLCLRRSNGALELPLWRRADAQASLQTVTRFLHSVRTHRGVSPGLDTALACCRVVDTLLGRLRIAA